ncbi:hypothetical protein [Nocardioides alkalitolerans]|uniref:hypothetical protein n=1 Tax=Nocardioides alkalitolerans TaxID=281714 RepID=UPI000420632E|nr:hypothetical protein [Nocardioides alkalitolerans]
MFALALDYRRRLRSAIREDLELAESFKAMDAQIARRLRDRATVNVTDYLNVRPDPDPKAVRLGFVAAALTAGGVVVVIWLSPTWELPLTFGASLAFGAALAIPISIVQHMVQGWHDRRLHRPTSATPA